eukprot:SAG22_NODE_2271_length_2767_cov_2.952547_1_plen_212_part_10
MQGKGAVFGFEDDIVIVAPPPPAPSLASAFTMDVAAEYLSALLAENPGAWDDGQLTPDELGNNPIALAMMQAIRNQIAETLGIDPSQVVITSLDNLGGNTPAPAPEPGSAVEHGMTLAVHPDFAEQLGGDAAFADCYLTPEEIASDPEAAAFALAFRQSTAAQLGVPVGQIILNGISTDNDNEPGCSGTPAPAPEPGSAVENGMTINVHPDF